MARKVSIKGTIVSNDVAWIYEYFDIDHVTPKTVEGQLKDLKDDDNIEVEINSGGGEIFAGSEIYSLLSKYKDRMTINIVGLAASAASVIAMAGKSYMSPTAMMMVHNVSSSCAGDTRDMAHMSEVLKKANQSIANAYVAKSGMSNEEALDMMNKETWLTAQQAKEKGLVDGIMFEDDFQLTASYSNGLLPFEVIEKMQNEKQQKDLEDKKKLGQKLENLRRRNNEI